MAAKAGSRSGGGAHAQALNPQPGAQSPLALAHLEQLMDGGQLAGLSAAHVVEPMALAVIRPPVPLPSRIVAAALQHYLALTARLRAACDGLLQARGVL